MTYSARIVGLAAGLVAVCAIGGCNLLSDQATQELAQDNLNPAFLAELGTPISPIAPGDEPFLVVRCLNMTDQRVVFFPSWASVDGTLVLGAPNIGPGTDVGFALPCAEGSPVERITLGDIENPTTASAWIVFDDFTRQELVPFTKILQIGVDYECGDVVVFAAVQDNTNASGYSIIYGVIDGSRQPDEFSGALTYSLLTREYSELINQGRDPFAIGAQSSLP